jgi:hypothetical protein
MLEGKNEDLAPLFYLITVWSVKYYGWKKKSKYKARS